MNFTKMRELLKGKKTYLMAIIVIIAGFYLKNPELISTGFVSMGIRSGLSNEVAKIIVNKDEISQK